MSRHIFADIPGVTLLLVAVALWIAIIVYTVTTLVPINNRIARLAVALPEEWREEHKKRDTYHRWRIFSLMIAMVCLVWGILRQCWIPGVAQRFYECHPQ